VGNNYKNGGKKSIPVQGEVLESLTRTRRCWRTQEAGNTPLKSTGGVSNDRTGVKNPFGKAGTPWYGHGRLTGLARQSSISPTKAPENGPTLT